MPLLSELSDLRGRLQDDLLACPEESLGPLGPKYREGLPPNHPSAVSAKPSASCTGLKERR